MIIGGGVIGIGAAYFLAKLGGKDIVVLEREAMLGLGSTGKCAGGIRQQFSSEVNIRLAMESVRFFENFQVELDADPEFRQRGYLFLASTPADAASFRQNVALQRGMVCPSAIPGPCEAGNHGSRTLIETHFKCVKKRDQHRSDAHTGHRSRPQLTDPNHIDNRPCAGQSAVYHNRPGQNEQVIQDVALRPVSCGC